MIFTAEKTSWRVFSSDFTLIRAAFIARARLESAALPTPGNGCSTTDLESCSGVPAERFLTDDGREILHAHGKAWALKPEVHAQRLAEAMEQARKRDAAMTPSSHRLGDALVDVLLALGDALDFAAGLVLAQPRALRLRARAVGLQADALQLHQHALMQLSLYIFI